MDSESLLEALVAEVAPDIIGMDDSKLAVLLAVCSLDDVGETRNRIHVLITGPPGTGKSKLIRFICRVFDYPYIEHRTTAAGLTGTLRAPGVLSKARVVGIDEFEKIPPKHRIGTLEAMSRGKVTIAQNGQLVEYDAAVRIIAACNSTSGLSPEQLDRFDLIMTAEYPSRDQLVRFGLDRVRVSSGDQCHEPKQLQAYVLACLDRTPTLRWSGEIRDVLAQFIDEHEVRSPRVIDGVVRLSLALARLSERHVSAELIEELKQLYERLSR